METKRVEKRNKKSRSRVICSRETALILMKQARVFISGTVQGVGYRYFVEQHAQTLHLTGWVRNTEDGGVTAIFQGEAPNIEQMIKLCQKGPGMSDVKQVSYEWEEIGQTFTDFIIHTDGVV